MLYNPPKGLIAKDFVLKEWRSVVRSLEAFLPHAQWLNTVAVTELLNSKPFQLQLAQKVGLTVPKTTITNNPGAVKELFDKVENGRVIFKSLTPLFLPPDRLLYTTEITREFPSHSHDSIAQSPAIYQELVERRSDLRITVVGCEVFVARIASQILEREKDRLDWRRCQDKEELYSEVQVKMFFSLFKGQSTTTSFPGSSRKGRVGKDPGDEVALPSLRTNCHSNKQ